MSLLALTKLLYLAERESMRRYAEPLTGDIPVSMEHGPVLSRMLDLTRGMVQSALPVGGWDAWITDREGHEVALRNTAALTNPERDLPSLSRADLDVLAETWEKFGSMVGDPWALVRWCHKNCHEWEDPGAGSFPIPVERLLRAVGFDDDQVAAAAERLQDRAYLQHALG